MIAAVIGIGILVLIGGWIFGGLALRLGGIVVAALGLVALIGEGAIWGLLLVLVGAVLWLAGHRHYAARHGYFKSPLAERLLSRRRGV